jgi:hypothetical protein
MDRQGEWQVAGSAPEACERVVVPAVLGAWAPILVELAHPRLGKRAQFPGGPFDIVYCQFGRQFFADRAAALRAAPPEE